jgi:hypothetical protein
LKSYNVDENRLGIKFYNDFYLRLCPKCPLKKRGEESSLTFIPVTGNFEFYLHLKLNKHDYLHPSLSFWSDTPNQTLSDEYGLIYLD